MAWVPAVAAAIAAGTSVVTNIANAREARKNRQFQERMSSTAHQRETADLRASGINPMLSRMGAGASSPAGDRAQMEDPGRNAVSTALAVQMQKAQINEMDARASLARTQAADISSTFPGRSNLMAMQAQVASLDADQRREMLPWVLKKAKEEVEHVSSSARAAGARAALDEAAAAGAENIEALEKRLGEAGPWVRLFFELMRGMRR